MDVSEEEIDQMTAALAKYFQVRKEHLLIFLDASKASWSSVKSTVSKSDEQSALAG